MPYVDFTGSLPYQQMVAESLCLNPWMRPETLLTDAESDSFLINGVDPVNAWSKQSIPIKGLVIVGGFAAFMCVFVAPLYCCCRCCCFFCLAKKKLQNTDEFTDMQNVLKDSVELKQQHMSGLQEETPIDFKETIVQEIKKDS